MEAVLLARRYEDDAARADLPILPARADVGPAAQDVVDFVLRVRLLRVCRPGAQLVQPGAQRGHAQELPVQPPGPDALGGLVRHVENLHGGPPDLSGAQRKGRAPGEARPFGYSVGRTAAQPPALPAPASSGAAPVVAS